MLFSVYSFAKTHIIFVPGLNFNVSRFSAIEKALGNNYIYHYFNIDYNQGDSKSWRERRDSFLKDIKRENDKTLLIAQSLGALLFYEKADFFDNVVYISPAFNMRFSAKLICFLTKFPWWEDLKSRNYEEYRLNAVTTKTAYSNLCDLVHHFDQKILDKSPDGLIAIDKDDELVDASNLPKASKLDILFLKKSSHNKFHHLIVDDFTLEKAEFARFIDKIKSLIAH